MRRGKTALPVELLSSIASFADQGVRMRLAAVSWPCYEATLPWLYHSPVWVSVEQLRRFAKHVPASYCRWIRTIDLSLISRRWVMLSEQELVSFLLRYTGAMGDDNEVHGASGGPNVARRDDTFAHWQPSTAPLPATADEEAATAGAGAAQRHNRLTVRQSYRHSVVLPPVMPPACRRSRLERLNIGWTNIRDRTVTMVLAHCGDSLRELSLDNCRLTDMAALAIAQWCPNLLKLDLGGTDVSDDGVSALAESCRALRRLSLSDCDLVTDLSVAEIAKHCRSLRMLDIEGCYGVLVGMLPQPQQADHGAPAIGHPATNNDDEWLTDVDNDSDSDDNGSLDVIEAA